MMKIVARVFVLWLSAAAAWGQDSRRVSEPNFPPVCARMAAALRSPIADEFALDTQRIQAALNSCPAGSAVELETDAANDSFLIGPITIPRGITLVIDEGVTVWASRDPRVYDNSINRTCGALTMAGGGCAPLITVNRADGAGIMGYGAIDGRGYAPMIGSETSWWELARSAVSPLTQNCPRMLQVSNTNGFTLYKITLRNSPNFHVAMGTDTNVTIWGVKILAPYDARNTDGIDPGYSRDVTITKSHISTGDDNVAVGASNSPGATNISVVDNWFGDGHGASIGSYTQYGASNILFDQLVFAGDRANSNQVGLRIKSDVSRGGLVENVTYSNICMQNVRSTIVLDPFYTAGATGNLVPQYRNIVMRNVHATTEGTVKIQGHDASSMTSVSMSNVQIDGVKASDVTAQYADLAVGPDPVNFGAMLRGTGVTVTDRTSTTATAVACPASLFAPVAGELIAGPPGTVTVQVFATKEIPFATYLANRRTDPNATVALPAPAGTVTIYDGERAVGSGVLDGGPLLRIAVGTLGPGRHTLTAEYSGDARYPGFRFGRLALCGRSAGIAGEGAASRRSEA